MNDHAQKVVDSAYEEVALIMGGFLAQAPVVDEAVWKLAGELTGSWCRSTARARRGAEARPLARDTLHPAIRAMLAAIRAPESLV